MTGNQKATAALFALAGINICPSCQTPLAMNIMEDSLGNCAPLYTCTNTRCAICCLDEHKSPLRCRKYLGI